MDEYVFDFLKLRVLSCYSEALMLKDGRMPPPRMAILYPTYVCNHRCIGCDYAALNQTHKSLSNREFDHILNELINIGVRGIEFCGGGEPTLHPYLPQAINRLVKNKIEFGLLTNGTNLTQSLIKKLISDGAYCRISMDAASKAVFDKYKNPQIGKSGFEDVIKNIKKLVNMRETIKTSSKLKISYKFTIDKNNYADVARAVELARKLKVDSVQFKLTRNVPSEIREPSIINELETVFMKMKKKYPDFQIIHHIDKTRLKRKCWLSPLQLTVDAYGDAYICCYYRHRRQKHRLGNILERSLKKIWYSESHWRKLRQIDIEECNKYDCRFHCYNEFMDKMVLENMGQLNFI